MRHSDYTIAVDENGAPYIAHADGSYNSARRAGAKYYQKIKTSYGTRYFYSPEEYKAFTQENNNPGTKKQVPAVGKAGIAAINGMRAKIHQAIPERSVKSAGVVRRKTDGTLTDAGREALDRLRGLTDREFTNKNGGTVKQANPLGAAGMTTIERMKNELKKDKPQFAEYDENDPDFSDENYEKAERIGDSDFVYFVRSDGHPVILEEDMKWVLPKGTDMTSPAFQDMVKQQEKMWDYQSGTMANQSWPSADERHKAWTSSVTNMINEAVKASRQK